MTPITDDADLHRIHEEIKEAGWNAIYRGRDGRGHYTIILWRASGFPSAVTARAEITCHEWREQLLLEGLK